MLQVHQAFFETILQFGAKYGPPVALGVLVLVGCGVVLRVLYYILSRGGPKKS
jgi:hypothetical protein